MAVALWSPGTGRKKSISQLEARSNGVTIETRSPYPLVIGGAMLVDRIETLRARHRSLEEAIGQENSRPLPSEETLTDLKRQKLRIKDQIVSLEHAI
jgi:hypothetical protein